MIRSDQRKWLDGLGLYFNEPEPAIICKDCGFAIKADGDRVSRHLGEKHGVDRKARHGLNKLVQSLELPDPAKLPPRENNSTPHPILACQAGVICRICGLQSSSLELVSRHIVKDHPEKRKSGRNGVWLQEHIIQNCVFQSWLAKDIIHAWRVQHKNPNLPLQRITARGLNDPREKYIALLREQEVQFQAGRVEIRGQESDDIGLSTSALLTNWMRRTGWLRTFRNADKAALMALSVLPIPGRGSLRVQMSDGTQIESTVSDERRLVLFVRALDRLFDRCADTVRHTDVSIRRWLRGRFVDRPYKAPFELVGTESSERRYRKLMKRCICLWVRLWQMPQIIVRKICGWVLSAEQRLAIQSLWLADEWVDGNTSSVTNVDRSDEYSEEASDSDDSVDFAEHQTVGSLASEQGNARADMDDAGQSDSSSGDGNNYGSDDFAAIFKEDPQADVILRFCYFLATEDFLDGQASSTLMGYFIAVCGLSPPNGAEFLRPAYYTTHLSGLIYCIRLIMLEAVLPRFAHPAVGILARPRRGHLEKLDPIRRQFMCDGTLSPMGELLNLLAYGQSLRRAEGPVFHFEWSDDGEEISWDGQNRLTMTALRGCIQSILDDAQKLSQQLMYDYDPFIPNFRDLRDRLSNISNGYSFLTDPVNKLQTLYLDVFNRGCLSVVDALLKVTRQDAGQWNVPAAAGYLSQHDKHLKQLLLLDNLTGGQWCRVSELLTVEHKNTLSRQRGHGVYKAYFCTIVRHNKTRTTTNNEFNVVRFLPEAVGVLMYKYLVYIRQVAYMIRRQCFNLNEESSLLFSPAAEKSKWSSKTLSTELRRYTREYPDIRFEIGAQEYRQLSIAITERHVMELADRFDRQSDLIQNGSIGAAFAWQSGHRPLQRLSTYGIDGAFPHQLQPALLDIYLHISRRWHQFLGMDKSNESNSGCRDAIISKETRAEYPSQDCFILDAFGEDAGDISCEIEQAVPQDISVSDVDDGTPIPLIAGPRGDGASHVTGDTISSSTHTTHSNFHMGPFSYLAEFRVLACRICKACVLPTEVFTHLSGGRHSKGYTSKERERLRIQVQELPGIIQSQIELKDLRFPTPNSPAVPYIAPASPTGIRCDLCNPDRPYIAHSLQRIQKHCRDSHGWKNHRKSGNPGKEINPFTRSVPWTTGVHCQRFFLSRFGSSWFEICRGITAE